MKLSKPIAITSEIPTCSMADISFLLIIFFILTTVFITERGIQVALPLAQAAKKLPKKNIAHIWISREGAISIDDKIVKTEYVTSIMERKMATNPDIIVSVLVDKDAEYGFLSDVFERLKEAKALRVSLATLKENS
ncbi:MAG: biopolymer transporter ExbD [bacterium]|nr:biopolymer transporter ExbD [bacterium]